MSIRALADKHQVHRRTVRAALGDAVPPARKPPARSAPVLGPYEAIIRGWLVEDLTAPRKQRHTARRVNYRVYGARKIWKSAQRAGHEVGRDQVARLMRAAGIEGVRRTKRVRTTKPDPGMPRHPDLVGRDFTATAPNQLWVTDIQCRRRHCRSYADLRTMPMFLRTGCGGGAFGVAWSA